MLLNVFARWRASRDASHQLDALLAQADASAPLVARNEWLMELGFWLRSRSNVAPDADTDSPYSEITRLRFLLQVLDRNPELATRFGETIRSVLRDNDARSLFVDTGMSARPGLASELVARMYAKALPLAPNRAELSVLFSLLFVSMRDARWVGALDETLVARLLAHVRDAEAELTDRAGLAAALADSIVLLCHQIAATGLDASIRQRVEAPQDSASVFMQIVPMAHALIATDVASDERPRQLNVLHAMLANARAALESVYEHLEQFGVSVDVVFQVERTRLRIERVDQLLDVWAGGNSPSAYARLTSELIRANQNRGSVRALLAESYALLGRKVVERSADTGEDYIARTRKDYFGMFKRAAGGGVVTAFTVYLKFLITSLALNKFIEGVLLTLDYVVSFLAIHFAHFTLATKQPAMTAPALAKKLDDVATLEGRIAFVDETLALIRSQVAAIAGNLSLVFPVALAVQLIAVYGFDRGLLTPEKAQSTINSFSLWGPTALFAAFTGVLLWLSSLTAGWADNWFALHRIHDALAYHRRVKWVFGESAALRVANFFQKHVAGVVASISLGALLGMVPTLLAFVGLPIEVRHVTLSTGSLAASVGIIGVNVFSTVEFWLAIGGIASMAVLNLGVSFSLAFSMALRSHGLQTRARRELRSDVWRTLMRHPMRAFLPPKV